MLIPKPDAILFDLDDTIIASDVHAERAWFEATKPHFDGEDQRRLLTALEESRQWFWGDPERHRIARTDIPQARRDIVRHAFGRLERSDLHFADELGDSYSNHHAQLMSLIDGAIDTIEMLRSNGIRLGMVTNGMGWMQRSKIDRFGLARYFEHIFIEGEVGVGKPDERIYVHALERMSLEPTNTWMIGDNLEWDVRAPKRVGLQSIWVRRTLTGAPEESQQPLVRSIAELEIWPGAD
jgi:putative hydrolase of the HAD superfamily